MATSNPLCTATAHPCHGPRIYRQFRPRVGSASPVYSAGRRRCSAAAAAAVCALMDKNTGGGRMSNSNYVVPLDKEASSLMRPLAEILRDLNKRVPEKLVKPEDKSVPWFHANRLLSFYAPGWCGEIRNVIFSDDGTVTVIYRVTVHGSDGEAHRESTGSVSLNDVHNGDPVAAAEEIAFCRACARFGLGLYLYHEDEAS